MKSFLISFFAIVALTLSARASMDLTFDLSEFLVSGQPLTANDLYITFAGATSDMVYNEGGPGEESIDFSGSQINYGGTNYTTSKSYSIADINANGLKINSATSILAYISYGSKTGFEQLSSGNPAFLDPSLTRFSQFEFSYSAGGTGGGIDMTNISQYGGSLRVETLDAGNTVQSFISNGNNLSTGEMFQRLAIASGFASNAVYTQGGKYSRIIGSNVLATNNPYHRFNQYIQSLGTGSPVLPNQIYNLKPGAAPGGAGSIGITSVASPGSGKGVVGNSTYNINYSYSANITQVLAPGDNPEFPDGTYQIELTGIVSAIPAAGGATIEYTGQTITIQADSPSQDYMTNFIYLQSIASGVNMAGWADLIADFGAANVQAAIQEKIAGDFAQAIAAGFAGSATMVDKGGSSVALGSLTTAEWFDLYNQYAYSIAQPINEEYYNPFANEIYLNSPGYNTQTTGIGDGNFDYGSVYGTPYDDRFSLNLITPNTDTTALNVVLLPDGNLRFPGIPEPTSLILLLGAGVVFLTKCKSA
ncbi:MAG: PEP-CTERM sorting domain-containing protein [Chthoniobacterales bacterium]